MSIQSLIQSGTKLWLDSVHPVEIQKNVARGATGATSNPIIISGIIEHGNYDEQIARLIGKGMDDNAIAWEMTDELVADAQEAFLPAWEKSQGNDGYVSFELDPLLEDIEVNYPLDYRKRKYIELGQHYALEQDNRMIKVPATDGGIAALEELAAAGVTINVTLCFTMRQYLASRDAIWRGAQRRKNGLKDFKSVYSIFVSRVDAYTDKHITQLSDDAQGVVGVLNAKEVWAENQKFWKDKNLRLEQEIVFASTGKKLSWQAEDYYVENLAGSDIQTVPPETIEAVEHLGKTYGRAIAQLPEEKIVREIHEKVDDNALEAFLMEEGLAKFTHPFKKLLGTIAAKRQELATANR
ncbi:MAG: transaldolase [Phycisphaerales bacterium]|nr:transaldolase [Phycisphaerales bacterium]